MSSFSDFKLHFQLKMFTPRFHFTVLGVKSLNVFVSFRSCAYIVLFFGFTIDIWTTSNHMVNFFRMTNAKALDNKERGSIVVQG